MTQRVDIRKAGAVIIRNRHFLVTRTRGDDVFIAPGGKLEPGETYRQALRRELREELQISIDERELEELGTFYAPAATHPEKMLEMAVFMVSRIPGEPIPSSEIEEIQWINTQTEDILLGSIFEHDVMPLLKQKDLID